MNRFTLVIFLLVTSSISILLSCTTGTAPESVPFTSTANESDISSEELILYVQEGQIWLLNVALNQTKQITFDEGRGSRVFTPKWSPDGRNFAYRRYGKLWLSDRMGETPHEIVTEANDFWWVNPTTLRYCQQKEDDIACSLFDIESQSTEAIQTDNYWIFSFSPDLTKIFIQEYQSMGGEIQSQPTQYILDRKTGQKVFEHKTGEGFWTEDPCWTSDGQKVAFTASLPEQTSRGEVYVVGANGDNLTQLTNFSEEEGLYVYPALLRWSPNDEWLALIITTVEANELAILKSDGSILKRLNIEWLTLGQSNLAPVWSPDSQQIAFLSNQIDKDTSDWQIYAVDIETGDISQLTNTSGNKTWLDWK